MNSPKYSFLGFKPSKNLLDSLKQAAYILIPAILVELQTNSIVSSTAAGIIGKVVFSAIEYFFKKY